MAAQAPTIPAAAPTIDAAVVRKLVMSMLGALALAAGATAAVIVLADRPQWWGGFVPALVIGLLGIAGAAVVLRQAVNRPLDRAVAIAFAASGVQFFVSLAGCLIALKIGNHPPRPVGLMVVGFYVAMLVAKSIVLAGAVVAPAMPRQIEGVRE